MPTNLQKVVIVNGNDDILTLADTMLEAGHYDVVFVESTAHAYSQIRRVQPNLVVLCFRADNQEALQVLSMLKLDPDTRAIPVVTHTDGYGAVEADEELAEMAEPEIYIPKAAIPMN